MQVQDGQTVIIGGLMLRNRSRSEAAFPGLSSVPLRNVLFRHEDTSKQDNQVMVFITLYRWQPGMETPLQAIEPFEAYPTRTKAGSGSSGG